MQFFSKDTGGGLTVASSELWIFFVLAVPFTAFTFVYWKWMERTQKSKACIDKADVGGFSAA